MKNITKLKYIVCTFCLTVLLSSVVYSARAGIRERIESQQVTLKMTKTSLKNVIAAIEKQTNLGFLYDDKEISAFGNIDVDVKNKKLPDVLSEMLRGSNLTYSIENGTIVIKTVPQNKQWTIQGKVVDEQRNSLPGATVRIKGANVGVSTDTEGMFKIQIPAVKGMILVFSFVGMQTKEVQVDSETELFITLNTDVSDLDEVTVVAYGERSKREMVGAVSSIKADDIKEVPTASFENLLQSQMSGVEVSNISGAPGGGGTRVNIRGYNSLLVRSVDGNTVNDGSPLYVVDGVPVNSFTSPLTGTNTLAEIDPSTIASVEVLKDAASAAIYGSRASNGVILITTKQGQIGKGKFAVNVSHTYSVLPSTPTQIIGNGERYYHILAARNQIAAYGFPWSTNYTLPTSYTDIYRQPSGMYDYFWNRGIVTTAGSVDRVLQDSLNPFYNNNTNWWKYAFRHGKILNANIQASGGTEKVKYMIGTGWYNEKGIMFGSDFKRLNLITNVSVSPRKNLKLDARINLSYTDRSSGAANTSFSTGKIEGMTVNVKGMSSLYPGSGDINVEILKELNETSEKNISFNIRPNIGLSYEFIPGLSLSASIAMDYSQSKKNSFTPSTMDAVNALSVSTGGMGSQNMFQNEDLLRYNFSLKESHNFDVLAGFSYIRKSVDQVVGTGKGSPSDDIHYVDGSFEDIKEISGQPTALQAYRSSFEEQIMVSGFGRLAYNYKQKYLTEITIRRDGSSVFGKDVRWSTFPSAAVAWAFSQENFMKNAWWLNYGKIRASWGKSGQIFSQSYLAHGTLEGGNGFLGSTGIIPTQLNNNHLTWEKTDQYDLGLDLDLLDYRLKFTFNYYYKYSKSLLWNTDLPGNVYFFENAWDNAMEISNEGVELEAKFDILRNTAVKWRARLNVSRNWNKFEKSYTGMDISPYVIGRSVFGLNVYKSLGIAKSEEDIPKYYDQTGNVSNLVSGTKEYVFRPGMKMIADLNNDGIINDKDLYYAGSTLPKAYGGIVNEVSWNGIDLNLLFSYSLGRKMVNCYSISSLQFDGRWNPVYFDYRNGLEAYPTITATNSNYAGQFDGQTDDNIETVNFLRLKQLTLGYNLPQEWMKKANIEGVRLFFTAENLFLLTNYSGVDPEVVDPTRGTDYFDSYPLARKLTIGLTLNF